MNDAMQVVRVTNAYRANYGLDRLRSYAPLMVSARRRARHITRTGIFSHLGWVHAISAQVRRWRRIGENIAEGYDTVLDVMVAWENSPEHRGNLLGDYDQIGVARIGDVWVQHFRKR